MCQLKNYPDPFMGFDPDLSDPLDYRDRVLIVGTSPIGSSMGNEIWAVVHEGILAALDFTTYGINEQDEVMRQLRGKFGPPTSFVRQSMQNYFGMKFESYYAVWKNSKVYVEYHGAEKTDEGVVIIETPTEHTRRLKSIQQSRPKPKF